jgi:hypothetical protein
MSLTPEPAKRAAFETTLLLAEPRVSPSDSKRPISIVAGALLVLLRVVSGVVVLVALLFDHSRRASVIALIEQTAVLDELSKAAVADFALSAYVAITATGLLVQLGLAIFILNGRNFFRELVMLFSTLSITAAFIGWWFQGQDIKINGTLVSLALDILILLALSSRSAAAYSRRNTAK